MKKSGYSFDYIFKPVNLNMKNAGQKILTGIYFILVFCSFLLTVFQRVSLQRILVWALQTTP